MILKVIALALLRRRAKKRRGAMILKVTTLALLKRKAKRLLRIKNGIFGNKCGFKLWTRKRAKTAIKRSLHLNDIAVKKERSEYAEIKREMEKLAKECEKVAERLKRLSDANKKASDALTKVDNVKCHISSRIRRRNRLNTQSQFGIVPLIIPQTMVADPIQVPVLLDNEINNADGQEEVVADQPIPNTELQNQVADQNVENLSKNGAVDEESVVIEEESQGEETNRQEIIPVKTTPPQALSTNVPVSSLLEDQGNDGVPENELVLENSQDSDTLLKNTLVKENRREPSVNVPKVIPQLLDSDSNTAKPPKEVELTVPTLLATDDATGGEEIVADQSIPNIESQDEIVDQNVENSSDDRVVEEECVVAEEESPEEETNEEELTDTIPPETLLTVAPSSSSLENEPQLLDSDSNTAELPREVESTVPTLLATDDATVEEEIHADQSTPNIEPQDQVADQNVENLPENGEETNQQEVIPAASDELIQTLSNESGLLQTEQDQHPISKTKNVTPPELPRRKGKKRHRRKGIFGNNCKYKIWTKKRSKTAINRSLQLNDIAVKKNRFESAEIRRRMQKLEEKGEKIAKRLKSLSVANKKARDALTKLDSLKCDISSKIRRRNRLNTQSQSKTVTLKEIYANFSIEDLLAGLTGDHPPASWDFKPKPTRQDYIFQLFKTAFEKYQPEEEASEDEFRIPGINASQDNQNDPENNSDANVNPQLLTDQDEGSENNVVEEENVETQRENGGEEEENPNDPENRVVEEVPVATGPIEANEEERLIMMTRGKLFVFYTTLYLRPEDYWNRKPYVLKEVSDYFKKTVNMQKTDMALGLNFLCAHIKVEKSPEKFAFYCALSKFMSGSDGQRNLGFKILYILSYSKGLSKPLEQVESDLLTELESIVLVYLNSTLNEYLEYHRKRQNRFVVKENRKFEWRSSLPALQIPVEFPSFKDCTVVKEGKERHLRYQNGDAKNSLYAVIYDFLSKTTIESRILDRDFCFIETAIAANPDTDPIEFEKKIFGAIFEIDLKPKHLHLF